MAISEKASDQKFWNLCVCNGKKCGALLFSLNFLWLLSLLLGKESDTISRYSNQLQGLFLVKTSLVSCFFPNVLNMRVTMFV